jgi:hypothetical protein
MWSRTISGFEDRLDDVPTEAANRSKSRRYDSIVVLAKPFSIRQKSRNEAIWAEIMAPECIVPMIQYSRNCLEEKCLGLKEPFGGIDEQEGTGFPF